jgi:type IV fimbrial biogenesis protein FimT
MLTTRNKLDRCKSRRLARGFSMIELMMGVAILAIVIKVAAPSFSEYISKSRLTSSVSTLVSDLNYARGEAIMRNAPVIVCAKVSNGSSCATTPTWQTGWVVCVDANSDNICDTASAAVPNPIRVRNGVSSTTPITAGAAVTRFSSVGAVTGNGAFTVTGGPASSPSRTIQVTSNGYVRSY